MALVRHIKIWMIFLTFCNPCIGANRQKDFTVTQTHRGYTVKVEGKVMNQLFVLSQHKTNKSDCLILRVVLNHGDAPDTAHQLSPVEYGDFIIALNSVLKVLSATFSLNKLRSIEIDLISLGDECLRITKDYKRTFKKKKNIDSHNVLSILWNSKLISDIQCVFTNYDLTISNIKIETPFYTDRKEFSSYNIVNKDSTNLVPNKVLRGIVYIYCGNINEEK